MSMATDLLSAQQTLMAMGGTTVELRSPAGALKATARGAFVNWTVEDQALRNDYDKEAQKFQMEPVTPEPQKQDYISWIGGRWTILDVHTRIISGTVICHVCVIRR